MQSRDGVEVNEAFLDWLEDRRPDRPFFAYLNYFDAHDPYLPPQGFLGQFGAWPESRKDFDMLLRIEGNEHDKIGVRELLMTRDRYDDCIAALDDQLGRLIGELTRRNLLKDTLVIVTSDHGESFGEHRLLGHATSLYLEQTEVPLVILAPGTPAGRVVREPVSLRDLPATVVDRLGLAEGSPFPGRSLAAYWRPDPGASPPQTTPAFSEIANATAFQKQPESGLSRVGFQMSLFAMGRHYVRDGSGEEHLYDLRTDPAEDEDLIGLAAGEAVVGFFRRQLLGVLNREHGTAVVEKAYLEPYREWLQKLVREKPAAPRVARRSGIERRRSPIGFGKREAGGRERDRRASDHSR